MIDIIMQTYNFHIHFIFFVLLCCHCHIPATMTSLREADVTPGCWWRSELVYTRPESLVIYKLDTTPMSPNRPQPHPLGWRTHTSPASVSYPHKPFEEGGMKIRISGQARNVSVFLESWADSVLSRLLSLSLWLGCETHTQLTMASCPTQRER